METNHTYLLQCSAKNDITAFRQLYDGTYSILYSVARRFVLNHHTAEDILQDSYLKIWMKAETFNAQRNLALAWMCTITKNTALDKLRADKSRPTTSIDALILETTPSAELKADAFLTHHNTIEEYLRSIKNLKPAQVQCLIFFNYYGYSHSELSKRFNVPLGTVKSWIRRSPSLVSLMDSG